MKKIYFSLYLFLFLVTVAFFCACSDKKRSIEVKNSIIHIDGNPFLVASAEVDYARIPREYWERQLKLMECMGLNTVTVKIPWMLHEPKEGIFDFEGMHDVKEFCRLAQEKGLLVWLHLGPYVGAEWDMGGMPWWLLNIDGIRLRSKQDAFMKRVENYFAALASQLSGSLLCNGGNIAIVQIEEAQGLGKNDKGYLKSLCECAKKVGFDNVLTFTGATKRNFMQTAIDEAYISLDIDSKEKADEHFTGIAKFRYDAPFVCSSIGGDYKTVWGGESAMRNWNKVFMRMFELLQRGTAMSINGLVEGTSFGATAGASIVDGKYKPYTTAHNTDGLLKLWGGVDKDFYKFRKTLYIYAQDDGKKQSEPDSVPFLSSFPEIEVMEVASIFENLPKPILSENLKTMEQCGVGHGAILYSTILPEIKTGTKLVIEEVHDYAQIFVNGKFVAYIDRRDEASDISLPSLNSGAKLDILVDATGRVGNIKGYKDYKGITKKVEIVNPDKSVDELTNWKIYPLPTDYSFVSSKKYQKATNMMMPGYYRITFNKHWNGDSYLYMRNWGKGEVWLNGKSLGRFWNSGPQHTLFVPACWLKAGSNELVIVDWIGPDKPVLKGLDYSIM